VVSLVCDSGNKYLSKIYNDYWLDDHGLVVRDLTYDLRDVITRPHTAKGAITVLPSDTLQTAYRKMKMYDVSQLPVMGNARLLGIISEMDILLAVTGNPDGFAVLVSQAMAKNLVALPVRSALRDLLPVFEQGMVAIVMEEEEFIGLITPIDLLQYLRKNIGHA
jgi:cystathionine beta-synthase